MLLVVAALWWAAKIYMLDGRTNNIQVAEQRLEELENQNGRARINIARRDDLQSRMALLERQLRIFEEFIPESEEVPELLDAISQQTTLLGLELSRLQPQAAEAGDYYTKQTFQIAVLGDYHAVGRFLARIASLPRIIKPTNVQISLAPRSRATRDMEAPLEVSFVIETFVLGATPTTPVTQGASRG
ncbi:MAG: type 4a pilus biogenesis protein PilO [Gemmatimonadetes bacterium]|nr:type 4a pilus biogenesis protein PilO [Gemmatimonadota bacterium]